jgi:7,8-dihydropterin-6-yl-methyl-4-(beta-D-ribofuranosyl)aminobenzene 5'-phosphate synthase
MSSIDLPGQPVDRRDVLCAGGAAVLSAMVATLLGGSKPVRAEGITGPVPEVDQVSVRVVVDSYQIAVVPGTTAGDVEIQHFGWGIGGGKPPGKTLISEFGLSMLAESRRGAETRNILMDFGFTPGALVNNVELLGIDPAGLDALVLSHGHWDHFGGLAGFLRESKGKLKARLPLYVGGEACFCSREWTAPPVRGDFGTLDRKALENADLAVTFAEGPALLADHAFTTGHIGLRSFEKVLSPSTMKIGVEDGLGCYPDRFTADERAKAIIPDLVQPSRRGQRSQAGPGGFGRGEGSCGDRRVPPRALQGGLRARDGQGAPGDGPRLPHSAALHRRAVLRDRQGRGADQAAPLLYGNPVRLCLSRVQT